MKATILVLVLVLPGMPGLSSFAAADPTGSVTVKTSKLRRSKNLIYGSFSIANDRGVAVRDVRVRCEFLGRNRTLISEITKKVDEEFPAHSTRNTKEVELGPVEARYAKSDCGVVGADEVPKT